MVGRSAPRPAEVGILIGRIRSLVVKTWTIGIEAPLTTAPENGQTLAGYAVIRPRRTPARSDPEAQPPQRCHPVGSHSDICRRNRQTEGSLDPFNCRQPGRCAIVVVSRPNSVRFDGGHIPSRPGVERYLQIPLTHRVRASVGTIVAEAQHIHGPIVLGHRG
jgi:hypothetical protein